MVLSSKIFLIVKSTLKFIDVPRHSCAECWQCNCAPQRTLVECDRNSKGKRFGNSSVLQLLILEAYLVDRAGIV